MPKENNGSITKDKFTKGKLIRLRKGELVKIAKDMGVSSEGIKAAIVERIIAKQEEEEPVEVGEIAVKTEVLEEEIKIICPQCGGEVTKDMTSCPECNFQFEEGLIEEDMVDEYECPDCGQTFTEPVPFCPDCGAEFEAIEEEVDEYECPDCHTIVSASEGACPWCGLEFEEEEEDAYKAPFEVGGEIKEEEAEKFESPTIFVGSAGYDKELDEPEPSPEPEEGAKEESDYVAPFETGGGEVKDAKELEEEARYEAPFDVENEMQEEAADSYETQTDVQKEEE
jgi:DNA-directed RNA polymerase subunit RPC12/RpoP